MTPEQRAREIMDILETNHEARIEELIAHAIRDAVHEAELAAAYGQAKQWIKE